METRTGPGQRQRPCGRHGLCFHPSTLGLWVRITIWLVKGDTLCYLSLFILFYLFYVVFFFGSLSFLAVPEIESLGT
ncbi:hypothetical protein GE21DRAFT_1111174 [Neurospora crassa]|nr:hypothetical protein GE21DRAFT_1111174 [Neurospora crassa]